MVQLPLAHHDRGTSGGGIGGWFHRCLANPSFQSWAARFPLTRGIVRRDGAVLFDLVAGFCQSQTLMALVELRVPGKLLDGPMSAARLAALTQIPEDRMVILLRAGQAGGLLKATRRGHFRLTRRGAALAGVPGLRDMILHHKILYRDLSEPSAFFRGDGGGELVDFWPYVFGAVEDPETARRYSDLMAQTQSLVAEDTLAVVDFSGVDTLMDIGGGTGAFLAAACKRSSALEGLVFDLPQVATAAEAHLVQAGLDRRVRFVPGSFRDDPLPEGADSISLVRVLYDHTDATVQALLRKIHDYLPRGGRLVISEPMTGGSHPTVAGDGYFALYTMAMGTGRARSAREIGELCKSAGFVGIQAPRSRRAYITSVVMAQKS